MIINERRIYLLEALSQRLHTIRNEKRQWQRTRLQRLFLIAEACNLSEVYCTLRCSHLTYNSLEFYFDLCSKTINVNYLGFVCFRNSITNYTFNQRFTLLIDDMLEKIDNYINELNHGKKE